MDKHRTHSFGREWSTSALLAAAAIASSVVVRAQAPQPKTAFEVVSVKVSRTDGPFRMAPWDTDRFSATHIPLRILVTLAYLIDDDLITGLPGWAASERYDINARAEAGTTLIVPTAAPLLRQLLTDRFKLTAHRESREVSGYALVVAKGGPALKASTLTTMQGIASTPGGLRARSTDINQFVSMLKRVVGRPVRNDTGLQGLFDITLDYAPEGATDSDKPSVYTALQEQLGLRLESRRVVAEHVVVDHVEHPTPD
jgi:uncharacterized protein (TIGR03435 family)